MQRTQQQWRVLLQNQLDSDLTIKQFCLEKNISPSSFYKHKATLRSAVMPNDTTMLPSPFSQVQCVESCNINLQHQIIVNVGTVELTLDRKTDARWLANLVGQLS
jgi:hypothetical protein